MSCRQHGYPWPSPATSPYCSSPLAGLQGYIPYLHIAAVCMFELVNLILLGHMWGSICGGTSLMSSSLLLQQCPACLVCLAWIVFMMGGRWPYNWCLVECCLQDLFNIARNVAYWPRPSCQKKKCTCASGRWYQGIRGWPWLSRGWIECELWRSQEVGGCQIII